MDLGSSGVIQTEQSYRDLRAFRQQEAAQKDKLRESRRIMRARLVNWAAWYRRDHLSEIDRDTGYKKTNMIGRIMAAKQRFLSDAPTDIDDDDAVLVYDAMLTLSAKHIQIIQLRFLDCYSVEKMAVSMSKSEKTIKRLQSDAVDALRASL